MRARTAGDDDRDRYNAFVASSVGADVLQAWEWGEVKRRWGWTPRRFVVEGDSASGEIVAAAQVLARRPVRGAPPLLYAPRGPVIDPARADVAPAVEALAAEIRRIASNAFVLKCDPPVEAGSSGAAAMERAGFRTSTEAGFGGVQPKAVMVLDLAPSLEQIFEGFHSKWRYNVRLAERKGVEVERAGAQDVKAFYDLLVETARRDRFLVRGRAYFDSLFEVLEPAGMIAMFLARFEGSPIAGALCMGIGGRLTYTYGASSNAHRNVMPNHLMQWHAIRFAKEAGYRVYDFRGVSPVRDGAPAEAQLAGLNRFKEGFGARYVEYAGTFDLPLRPLVYAGWRWGAPVAIAALKRLKRGRVAAEADV